MISQFSKFMDNRITFKNVFTATFTERNIYIYYYREGCLKMTKECHHPHHLIKVSAICLKDIFCVTGAVTGE